MTRALYPKISANSAFHLAVGDGHEIYVECSGNPDGLPVIYCHGGPGAGCSEGLRRYFDPEKYHIILFDQRGCGRSTPSPSIEHNTLVDLIADMEKIRYYLTINKWLVCGGSWGTTLALAYGIEHAEHVSGFILRGIFLGTQEEYEWLYKPDRAAYFFPKYYRDFTALLKGQQLDQPLLGYQQLLTSENELLKVAASKAWYLWESRISSIEHSSKALSRIDDPHQALCMAQISNHYFVNYCFLSTPILSNIDKIKHLPAILIHGRYDMVCQLQQADKLAQAWSNAQLQILPCAGHSGFELQTIDAFCKATDTMANFIKEVEE
ncbi:MAG: prolyl aminopeptidase [Thalassotalea sp.]